MGIVDGPHRARLDRVVDRVVIPPDVADTRVRVEAEDELLAADPEVARGAVEPAEAIRWMAPSIPSPS